MEWKRQVRFLLPVMLVVPSIALGQGGRGRGNQQAGAPQPAQQGAPPAATQQPAAAGNAAGRGGAPANTGSGEFYNYDTTAAGSPSIPPDVAPVETHQKITVNGEALAYTTRAGYLALHNATTGASVAHLFYTSYSKDGVSDASGRPIVIFFGGAPGMAAAWQEFGGLGPKRVKIEGSSWTENAHTLLGQADLVFVNPVGTGFSRPDQPSKGPSFWSSANDVESLAEFVRSYLNHNNRRASPLYLAGEDRGTGRAAGIAAFLADHEIPVRGLVLLNITESADSEAGDAQYITLLPSLVMSAWYHKKQSPDLSAMGAEQIAGQARQFASREYLHALYKGDRMTSEERTKVVADLSRLTGLPKSFVAANNLRIPLDRFAEELMRGEHQGLSNSDARVMGFAPPPAGGGRGRGGFGGAPPPAIDFYLSGVRGPFLNAYETYLRHELSFTANSDGIYYLTSGGVGQFTGGNDDASVSAALARDPGMRVFVAINYYDLSAPFYATEFTLAHLSISPEVRAHNITIGHYEAGGMPYLDDKELAKLHRDLAAFLTHK